MTCNKEEPDYVGFSSYFADEEEEWHKRIDRLKQHESSFKEFKKENTQDTRLQWNKKIRFSQHSKGIVKKYVRPL